MSMKYPFIQIENGIINCRKIQSMDSGTTKDGRFFLQISYRPVNELHDNQVIYFDQVAQKLWKYFTDECNQRFFG